MSSAAEVPSVVRLGPQRVTEDLELEDQHAAQSTILHLLEEATRLATPAATDGVGSGVAEELDKRHQRKLLPPTSGPPASAHSQEPSGSKSLSSFSCSLSIVQKTQGSSPWEAMSLINLQCEKLLNEGRGCMDRLDTTLAESGMQNCSAPTSSTPESCAVPEDGTNKSTGICSVSCCEDTLDPPTGDSFVCHSVPSGKDVTIRSQPDGQLPYECVNSRRLLGVVELGNESALTTLDPNSDPLQHKELCITDSRAKWEVLPKANAGTPASLIQLEAAGPCIESQTANSPHESLNNRVGSVDKMIDFTSSLELAMDCNSNMCLSLDLLEDKGSVSTSTKSLVSLDGDMDSVPSYSAQHVCASMSYSDPNNNVESLKQQILEGMQPSSSQARWHRRNPRKQAHPTRSAGHQDPHVQGVTFQMYSELDDSSDQCRLLITSNYREDVLRRGRRARGGRSRSFQSSHKTSSSEEESDGTSSASLPSYLTRGSPNYKGNKVCASCCTRKTPLWRDAEDGTPLCNACGIRYKKYRVRCPQCWNIPRKEGNSNSTCPKCGDALRLTALNKRTSW